jgi:hypothetical protein
MGARFWQGGAPRRGVPSGRRSYRRKCYREFIWRRRMLDEIRRTFADRPELAPRLSQDAVRALFDCDTGNRAGLWLAIGHLLRGEKRQADQIWRLWRGKAIYCAGR